MYNLSDEQITYDPSAFFPTTACGEYHDNGATHGLVDELLGDSIAMPPPEQFDQDVEQYLLDSAYSNQLPAAPDFDPYAFNAIDWTAALALSTPSSLSRPSTVLSGDSSFVSAGPFSPLSDATLVSDSDFGSPSLAKGWSLIDDFADPAAAVASDSDAFSFAFTFEAAPNLHLSPALSDVRILPSSCFPRSSPASLASEDGYELPLPLQHPHRQGAAAADAPYSLGAGMAANGHVVSPTRLSSQLRVSGDTAATTSTTLASPRPPTLAASAPACKREARADDNEDDVEYAETKPAPAKRRRRQDTTPRYTCNECGTAFARSHNLKVHVRSVHDKVRAHACGVAGCRLSFSRRHDLTRHHISKHTDEGSPRRKDKVPTKPVASARRK
ncbi:hypothetical protein BV20DRAFT_1124002 [Pilatotrama ljubarskyi]|nr:hypothetical protein BV20DRAFT_1124002 [Pilatotrama ljubarskyi]